MIEQIEEIAAQRQPMIFAPQRYALRQTEIEVGEAGPGHGVSAFVAKLHGTGEQSRCWRIKRTLVKPSRRIVYLRRRESGQIRRRIDLTGHVVAATVRVSRDYSSRERIADHIGSRRISKRRR